MASDAGFRGASQSLGESATAHLRRRVDELASVVRTLASIPVALELILRVLRAAEGTNHCLGSHSTVTAAVPTLRQRRRRAAV